jgi:multiple sugar transport system permease protein
LIGTIILPGQVTLIPTYAFFARIGWTGTWLPLTVPHFFANAYNVFLLRQFFLTLPKELDEAAMIDGATPWQVLIKVIIPQAWPAIISVGLFHFIFAWNDYFGPLIYLLGHPELQPISVGVQEFNFAYGAQPQLVQATSLMAMVLPLVIFFFAQKIFMRGVVITGVEK